VYATRAARPPVSAIDEHGHDVQARIAQFDRTYPDDFALQRIRGYAQEHTLTLDLKDGNEAVALRDEPGRALKLKQSPLITHHSSLITRAPRTLLLLTGLDGLRFLQRQRRRRATRHESSTARSASQRPARALAYSH
jgi:hypothetical protein